MPGSPLTYAALAVALLFAPPAFAQSQQAATGIGGVFATIGGAGDAFDEVWAGEAGRYAKYGIGAAGIAASLGVGVAAVLGGLTEEAAVGGTVDGTGAVTLAPPPAVDDDDAPTATTTASATAR